MTKIFLCLALLAMSYIASANVDSYDLPLDTAPPSQNEISSWLSSKCETTDGKFYYLNQGANQTVVLEAWNSKDQTLADTTDVTSIYKQMAVFLVSIAASSYNQTLQCIGTNVYISTGYQNATNTGLQLFLINSDAEAPNYALTLNDADMALSQTQYLTQGCSSADGKFYYVDTDNSNKTATLRAWDSDSASAEDPVNATLAGIQVALFIAELGEFERATFIVQCVGNTPYLSAAYENETHSGLKLFAIQDSLNVDTYDLPLNSFTVTDEPIDLLSESCATTDGKLHYIDYDTNSNMTLQEWNSKSNSIADTASLIDVTNQVSAWEATLGKTGQIAQSLQCIGNNVYANFAWSNSTDNGIELFVLKKSGAGILSFSFAALFLAVVALLF